MHTLRRALTVAAVAAAGTLTFALPAWAHTPRFEANCDSVTITLSQFAKGENTVHISRDGKDLGGDISPTTFGTNTTIEIPEGWDNDTVTYRVSWQQGDLADHFTNNGKRFFAKTLTKPGDCEQDTPPVDTPPENNPPEENPPSDTDTSPAKSPTPTTTAAPATTSPAPVAVDADKLANTGAGNTVPLLVVGAVLVAGGVGLTFLTRHRRGRSASS